MLATQIYHLARHERQCQLFASLLFTIICLTNASLAVAEVIEIPVGQQAPEHRLLPRPTRGMSEDLVLARFGEPLSVVPPVGAPPISKWVYRHFTVYFESSVVIHSVLRHTPKHPELIAE